MARGGAETQVAVLAIELRKRGWDVHIVSLIEPSAFEDELAAAGVPLHFSGVAKLPFVIRRLRPQILHCHMFHANIAGRLLRLFMPFRAVICTLHSVAESGRASDRIRFRDFLYRITDRLSGVTTAVSQAVADRHQQSRAVRRARVIPNGVDLTRFRPDAAARVRLRSELNLGEEFVWIAAGRLMWKKNYPALLEAHTRGVLLIAGSGPEEADLRRRAGPNVRFLGARGDLPELFNAADAFVLSSVVEGLPLALLEAAACGLPCVSTDVGGVRETGIGIVTSDLRTAMDRVMDMTEPERSALGHQARTIVEQRYSMDAVVSQWEALYRSM
jgi:glycosyltransferase involved in cell wall biosynthesis